MKAIVLKSNLKLLLDNEDYLLLKDKNIFMTKVGYAAISVKRKNTYIHRIVFKAKKGQMVDHINRNPLDCRKNNLRLITQRQNFFNSDHADKARGVVKNAKTWTVRLRIGTGVRKSFGPFKTEKIAHEQYKKIREHYIRNPVNNKD